MTTERGATMGKTLYSHELRTLLCGNCGAPVEVGIAGGTARCTYCGASHTISRRDESADLEQAEQAPAMAESERLSHLRAQDANPPPMPPGLAAYVTGTEIPPEKTEDARRFWQLTRQLVQDGAPLPDQDRLFYLTVLLSRVVDDRTCRPLLESALELLSDPRHRHVLRCSLAQHAVVAGDPHAAQDWLKPCNPRPTDLQMDTAYRVAAACLATAKRDYNKVFSLLGSNPDDIPLADENEAKAEMLRANATERKYGAAAGTEQLAGRIYRDPRRLYDYQQVARELDALRLCPQSTTAAANAAWQALDGRLRPVVATSPGCVLGGFIVPIGGLALSIAGGLGFLGDHTAIRVNLFIHPLIWLVIVPTVLLSIVYVVQKSKKRLNKYGQLGFARVVSSSRGGTQHSPTATQSVTAHVQAGDQLAEISKLVTSQKPVPLGVYPCLFDPNTPTNVKIQFNPLL